MAVVGTQYSETFSTGVAGETWTVAASYIDGAVVVWTPTITDLLLGRYLLTFTPTLSGAHAAILNGSVSGDLPFNLDVLTVAQADPVAALGYASLTVVTPVTTDGDAEIVKGDDYKATDDRALSWATTSAGQWPDLTGATVSFIVSSGAGHVRLTKAMTITQASGEAKSARLELTAAETNALPTGNLSFDIRATLSNLDVVTLVHDATLMVQGA